MKMLRLLAAIGLALALAGCGDQWTYRFKLTLDVEIDGQVRSGSGVIQVFEAYNEHSLGGNVISRALRGEAVAVDLGPRGVLFATLKYQARDFDTLPRLAFKRAGLIPDNLKMPDGLTYKDMFKVQTEALQNLRAKTALLVPQEMPFLVRFRDPKNPMSVEEVQPGNLAATFGGGARLLRATIEMTDAPVTTGIDARLPWLANLQGSLVKNLPYEHIATQLKESSFKQGR